MGSKRSLVMKFGQFMLYDKRKKIIEKFCKNVSFRHTKETSKNVADTIFKNLKNTVIYCEYWENSGNSFFKEHLMGNCYWTAVTVLVFLMLPSNPCRTFAVIRCLSVLTSNQYLLAGSSVDTAVVIRRYSKKLSPRKFRKLLNTYPKCGKDFNKNACRRVYLSFVYI